MKLLHIARTHRSLGAKFMPFAGWEMPLKYTRIIEEHLAVRNAVGLFDISHMGEISVQGERAAEFLQRMTSNDVSELELGGAQYSTVPNERGGAKDDVFVYRVGGRDYMVVVNATNVDKISGWLKQHTKGDVRVKNITDTTVMLALQGPRAQAVLQQLTDLELGNLKYHKATRAKVAGVEALVSRSGYTGEDGFELYIFNQPPTGSRQGEKIWSELLRAGKEHGIRPCGLGARDSLRLEAGLVLYGHELTEKITPLEARIDFAVKFDKGKFIGRDALLEQRERGIKRKRVGLRMKDRGIPREGYKIFRDDEEIGLVTSGGLSPVLRVGIAMGYAPPTLSAEDEVSIEIRGSHRTAEVVGWPFHRGG